MIYRKFSTITLKNFAGYRIINNVGLEERFPRLTSYKLCDVDGINADDKHKVLFKVTYIGRGKVIESSTSKIFNIEKLSFEKDNNTIVFNDETNGYAIPKYFDNDEKSIIGYKGNHITEWYIDQDDSMISLRLYYKILEEFLNFQKQNPLFISQDAFDSKGNIIPITDVESEDYKKIDDEERQYFIEKYTNIANRQFNMNLLSLNRHSYRLNDIHEIALEENKKRTQR